MPNRANDVFRKPLAHWTSVRRVIPASRRGYNRVVRIASAVLLALCLAGCNRGNENKDAVRQGIIDHLAARQMSTSSMDLNVTSVEFNGNKAEAVVTFAPKGGTPEQGMSMRYELEQQGSKWVVVGRKDAGGHGSMPAPNGNAPAPGGMNPHGGGNMPAPESLPPATPKK